MKHTAQDQSLVANIAQGEAQCYICHKTLIKTSRVVYFILMKVSANIQFLGHFNTFTEQTFTLETILA